MQGNHWKMKNLKYNKPDTQSYLRNNNLSINEKKEIFKFRTHMKKFKGNYKSFFTDLEIFEEEKDQSLYTKIFSENIPNNSIELVKQINHKREDMSFSIEHISPTNRNSFVHTCGTKCIYL